MRALILPEKGIDKLQVVDNHPRPVPNDNQLLVKMIASSVNPVDWKMAEYGIMIPSFPCVLGCDIAGEVVEKGSNVHNFQVGDIVFGLPGPGQGCYSEYALMTPELAVKVPHNITPEQAASFPVAVYTCYLTMFCSTAFNLPTTGPRNDDERTILIWGGASSTGMVAIQILAACGYHVITTASAQNHDYLRSLGAHEVFNYRDENVVEQIRAATNNRLCYAYDCAGDDKVFDCLTRDHPAHVAFITRFEMPVGLPENFHCHFVLLLGVMSDPSKGEELFRGGPSLIERLITEGRLLPPKLEIFQGLEGIVDALLKQKHGVNATKVIIKIS